MTRVLLTGATGVVGRLAIPMLLERGYAAAAVVAALELPAGAYNVCDDEPLTRAG
ncbi:MAG: hypothetical protein ACJ79O_00565 [Myxococcales bacterium]